MFKKFALVLICWLSLFTSTNLYSQTPFHATNDYKKCLWMTTRFYGAQRSGDNNWTVANHLPSGVPVALRGRSFVNDADGGTDLSGGWHDCGDHVKFGQTQFYSAYVLLKGYAEFTGGYDDRYSFNYSGYIAANNYTFEGTGHDPNCIPDVLDEMKHATDFFIKCTPNSSTFYYEVGNGNWDHAQWVTSVKMQTLAQNQGGDPRPHCKNPNDGAMASYAGATLALMSRVYQPYDAAYAALCLTHALNAYNYARTRLGNTVGACSGSFYGGNRDSRDAFVSLCAELYWKTGTAAYQTEAYSHEAGCNFNPGWAFDYLNGGELGLYNLAKLGNASATTRFNNRITGHYLAAGSRNGAGVYTAYGTWGRLRYNGNAAFLIALYSKLNNNTTAAVLKAIYDDVDYIMGKNGPKRSYIVGFAPAAGGPYVQVQYPHHRNAYLRDDNPGNATILTIPAKNQQLGALVGGQRDGSYNDDRSDYVNSEVCIDYNAGLVGALGFINERIAPVTISCGGNACWQPNLGANLSTCSSTFPIVLDAKSGNPGGSISYRWYTWNGSTKTIIGGATARTYSVASLPGGVIGYIVERDSAYTGGPCTKRDTIFISTTIPSPTFSGPLNICSPATYNLTPTNLASFPGGTTWQWAVDYSGGTTYTNISGATASTLSNVRTAGRYRLTATAGSCNSNGNVVITSSLPTPVDGCRTGTGTVNLSITNTGTGPYQWYAAATGGSSLTTGTSYTTPSISSTTTYYVQDMAAASGSVGPTSQLGAGTNWGVNTGLHVNFTATQNFTINSLQVPFNVYSNSSGSIDVEILDGAGNPLAPARIFTSAVTNVTTAQNGQLITFNFTGFTVQSSWGPNLRMRLTSKGSINGDPLWSAGPAAYNYNSSPGGIVSITGQSGGGSSTQYNYFYNWQISTGTPCDRLPVIAYVNPPLGCGPLPVTFAGFNIKDHSDNIYITWATSHEENNAYFSIMRSSDGVGFIEIGRVNGTNSSAGASLYSHFDFNPLSGVSYYKIVQYDYNGLSTETHTLVLSRESMPVSMQLIPNPFNRTSTLSLGGSISGSAAISVNDLSGREVSSYLYKEGDVIEIGNNLEAGVYIVRVVTVDGEVLTSRIVKQ